MASACVLLVGCVLSDDDAHQRAAMAGPGGYPVPDSAKFATARGCQGQELTAVLESDVLHQLLYLSYL